MVEKVGIDRSLVLVVSTITDDDVAGISLITMLVSILKMSPGEKVAVDSFFSHFDVFGI
jgi:hypothetical protein